MQISADFVTWFDKFLFQLKALQKRVQKDVNRFFVAQAVPEIYGKNERLKNRGMCFFVIDCRWFWKLYFSRISPELLELQKSYLHLFTSSSEELSDEIRIFQIWGQNQLIFAKTLFCQKKISYWKKSTALKYSKTFFHGSKV